MMNVKAKETDKSKKQTVVQAEPEIIVLTVDDLYKNAAELADKEIVVKGTVMHICKSGGERCFIMGSSEDVVIRILDKSSISQGLDGLSLESLGLEESVSLRFRKSIREPYGMVLITGPTGSGKTTTLYAALNELNTGEENTEILLYGKLDFETHGIDFPV